MTRKNRTTRKTKPTATRLRPDDRRRVELAARLAGESLSAYIRRAALARAKLDLRQGVEDAEGGTS